MFNTVPSQSASRDTFRFEALSSGSFLNAPTRQVTRQPINAADDDGFWEALAEDINYPTMPPVLWELTRFGTAFFIGFFVLLVLCCLAGALLFCVFAATGEFSSNGSKN